MRELSACLPWKLPGQWWSLKGSERGDQQQREFRTNAVSLQGQDSNIYRLWYRRQSSTPLHVMLCLNARRSLLPETRFQARESTANKNMPNFRTCYYHLANAKRECNVKERGTARKIEFLAYSTVSTTHKRDHSLQLNRQLPRKELTARKWQLPGRMVRIQSQFHAWSHPWQGTMPCNKKYIYI